MIQLAWLLLLFSPAALAGYVDLPVSGGGGGSGTVTSVSVTSANGLAGSVANATTTPAITLSTSITGLLKGNGTAISAASSGSDYSAPNANTTGSAGSLLSTTANPASVGTAKLSNADNLCWRNAGNTADTCITLDASNQLSVGSSGQAISTVLFGNGSTASGTPAGVSLGVTAATGSNIAGANTTIQGGNSTGTGVGGSVVFKAAAAGSTGSSANTLNEIARLTPKGFSVGDTTAAGLAALYIHQTSTQDTGVVLESGTTAGRKMSLDFSGANSFLIGKSATNGCITIAHTATGGTGANWFSMSGGNPAGPPPYPKHFNTASADGNVTALSSVKSLDGVNINDAPWVVQSNANATVNTIVGWVTTGSSKNPMSFVGSRNITQTSTAEDADLMLSNQNAGTLTEHVRIKPKGQIVTLGTAPAAGTCGTSPGTPTGNDNFFKITSGTGGASGTCAVTLATAPLTAGNCYCRDKTTTTTTVDADVSGSTVTMTTFSRTTGTAINFAASDVFECQCRYF